MHKNATLGNTVQGVFMQYKVVLSNVLYPEHKEIPGKNGSSYKVLDTYVNLEWLLAHFKAEIKYNLMTRRREIVIPGHFISSEDYDNSALSLVQYLATLNDMPIKFLNEHLNELALKNAYHPIAECIKNNPWDGIRRLDTFVRTIETTNQEMSNLLIKTWMRSAIAAAFSVRGFTCHGALVIQGKQGIGKTAWIKTLDPVGCDAIKEGALLDPALKDCIIGLSQFWIVELGELDATYRKADIARIKSFITMESDNIRNPYARNDNRRPRRTAYIATVNNSNYLVDDTGNRRWWTIEATKINYQHNFDMKQVWAEVYNEWKIGELTYLPKDLQDKVNKFNEEHERIDPLKEKLLAFYDWSSIVRKWRTCTQILEELGYKNPTHFEASKIGTILTELNGTKGKRSNGLTKHEVPAHIQVNN